MTTRNELLEALKKREPLGEKKLLKDTHTVHGVSQDSLEMPSQDEILYDIAISLRFLIDTVIETWE